MPTSSLPDRPSALRVKTGRKCFSDQKLTVVSDSPLEPLDKDGNGRTPVLSVWVTRHMSSFTINKNTRFWCRWGLLLRPPT